MGDGYARMSGETAIVQVAGVGLPNALTQMVNTFKDRIPMLLTVAAFGRNQLGADTTQDYDFQNDMAVPISKWQWTAMTGTTGEGSGAGAAGPSAKCCQPRQAPSTATSMPSPASQYLRR